MVLLLRVILSLNFTIFINLFIILVYFFNYSFYHEIFYNFVYYWLRFVINHKKHVIRGKYYFNFMILFIKIKFDYYILVIITEIKLVIYLIRTIKSSYLTKGCRIYLLRKIDL